MRLGVAQIDTRAGDLAHTVKRVVAYARTASERGCELLMFGLTTLSGPTGLPYVAQASFRLDCIEALRTVSAELACPCLMPIVSIIDDVGPAVEVLLVDGQGVRSVGDGGGIDVRALDGALPSEDKRHLTCSMAGQRLRFCFAYGDLDELGEARDAGGYDVVVFLSGYGYAVNDPSSALGSALSEGRYPLDARAAGTWLVGVGSVGGYGGQIFAGSSFVLSPQGRPLAVAAAFEEDLIVADVGTATAALEENGESLAVEPYDEPLHLWQALALGLADYVQKTDRRGAVFVYDGTLGACALAALASDALGPTQVRMLLAPGLDQERQATAESLGRALRLTVEAAPTGATAYAVAAQLLELGDGEDYVVLSAKDKTALALEAVSPWDRMAELMPLGDVYRIDILGLMHARNAITPLLPKVALHRDDLLDFGIAYDERIPEMYLGDIDFVLEHHHEGERTFGQLIEETGTDLTAVIEATRDAYARCASRRRLRATCLMASTCTIGEAALPVGFGWHDAGTVPLPELEPELGGEEPRDVSREVSASLRTAAVPDAAIEGMLRETLDLLRDISVGSGTDWKNPFSEN